MAANVHRRISFRMFDDHAANFICQVQSYADSRRAHFTVFSLAQTIRNPCSLTDQKLRVLQEKHTRVCQCYPSPITIEKLDIESVLSLTNLAAQR